MNKRICAMRVGGYYFHLKKIEWQQPLIENAFSFLLLCLFGIGALRLSNLWPIPLGRSTFITTYLLDFIGNASAIANVQKFYVNRKLKINITSKHSNICRRPAHKLNSYNIYKFHERCNSVS